MVMEGAEMKGRRGEPEGHRESTLYQVRPAEGAPSPLAPPLTGQPRLLTALGVGVAVRLSRTAHDVGQVDRGPGEGHAVAAQAGAELLGCQAQLLQLLFVLWGEPTPSTPHKLSAPDLRIPGYALPSDPFTTSLSLHMLTLAVSTSFITM